MVMFGDPPCTYVRKGALQRKKIGAAVCVALQANFSSCAPPELYNHSSDRSLFDVDSNGEQENLAGNAEVEEQERELRAKLMERFHA